jgi:lipopolysaccharide transport system permease protein
VKRALRLLLHLAWWDLVAQYFGSWVGVLWNVVLPALVVGVYMAVFEVSPRFSFGGWDSVGGYGVNLVAGLVPWLLFQEGVSRAASAFVDQRHLVTQLPIPAPLFPLANVASALVRHAVALGIFVGILLAQGFLPTLHWAGLLVVLPVLLLLTTGAALVVACGTLLQRDVAPTVGAAMLPLFFATPVIYPPHVAPEALRVLMDVNPLSPVVLGFRDVMVTGRWPLWPPLLWSAAVGATLLLLGVVLVRRLGPDLAERL